MKAKNLLLTFAVGAMAMSCNTGSVNQTSTPLKTESDTAVFYLGYLYGNQIKGSGIKDINMNAWVAGMNSGIQKKDVKVPPQSMEMYLNRFFQQLTMKRAQENAKKGEEFMKKNASKSGIDTLANGIQYEVLKKGEGAKPAATDVVKVNYVGTLIDGTQFDASKGSPAQFRVNQVIPGWTTALQAMPVGSKWKVYIPADQAYGMRGAGNIIGPNETLIFEIELLEIVPPATPAEKK